MKKITIGKLEKICKANEKTVVVNWNKEELEIKKTISLADFSAFVNTVAEVCFDSDNEYKPEYLDFAIRVNTISFYSNIALSSDGEKTFDLLYNTDAYDVIRANVNKEQYDALMNAVEAKIEYMLDVQAREMKKYVMEFNRVINDLSNKLSESFEGIDTDELNNVFHAIGKHGAIDENKIAEVVINNLKNNE